MALKLYQLRNLRAARVLVLGQGAGHRPSKFNVDVGKCMMAKGAKPSPGGRYSKEFQKAFVDCVRSTKTTAGTSAKVKPETLKRFGLA